MSHIVSQQDWADLRRMFGWFRSLPKSGPISTPGPQGNLRASIVVTLLQDITNGMTGSAALMKRVVDTHSQLVSLNGYATAGSEGSRIKIGFHPTASDPVEWTDVIEGDDTADAVRTKLLAISYLQPRDVEVRGGHRIVQSVDYDIFRWLIIFRGQYAGREVPLLEVEDLGPDVYADTVISMRSDLDDTGEVVEVICAIPLGSPTPLRRGAVCVCSWVAGFGWTIVSAECRELQPVPVSV